MKRLFALLLALPLLALAQADQGVAQELAKLAWQNGPSSGAVADRATIEIPQGFVFLDAANTSRFLELNGNPPRDDHFMVAPSSLQWFSVFSFDEQGYVKDDETLDAQALLTALKASDEPGNQERKRLGMQAIFTDGWEVAPHYDAQSKHLEWGVRLRTEDAGHLVNYTSRLLGRKGIMSAVLVSSPENLTADAAAFKDLLAGYAFMPGEKYSEFKQGDRMAKFGLAALVLGGAAAVATKKGFWAALVGFVAAFWKLLAGLAIAALAGARSLFKRRSDSV